MLFKKCSKFQAKSEEVFEVRKVFTIPQYDKMKANYSSFIQHIQVHLSVYLIKTKHATYHSYHYFGALNQVFVKLKTKLLRISEAAVPRCSQEKVFGKDALNLQENTLADA